MITTIEDLTDRQVEAIKSHKATLVYRMPDCDFCKQSGVDRVAKYDARTTYGPWANMCEIHFRNNAIGLLGTGHGQELIASHTLTNEMVRAS